jgi:hypothetical protein
MDKREGEEEQSSKTYTGVAKKNAKHCSDNCMSNVTVNGQHTC